jgi:hypothetical protein
VFLPFGVIYGKLLFVTAGSLTLDKVMADL